MRWGVVVFPGSNDDRDALRVAERQLGDEAVALWHKDRDLRGADVVLLPGGFSYGDYLRCGAMAGCSPIMDAVRRHAAEGGLVLGICNGFQVLCEAGLLPGALVRNEGLAFVCDAVDVTVENASIPFTTRANVGDVLTIPIKHGEGRYVADPATLKAMTEHGQIVLRYRENPNGSTESIAGVTNERGNVFGMMPHPEHAVDASAGIRSADGAVILGSLIDALVGART